MIGTEQSSESMERPMGQKIGAELYVIIGVLIGNLCHTPTALMLISFWIIVRNPRLPEIVGGKCPQELIADVSIMIYGIIMTLLFKRNSERRQVRNTDRRCEDKTKTIPMVGQDVAMSSYKVSSSQPLTSKTGGLSFSFVNTNNK